MKNCIKCGTPLPDNALFCSKCGEKMQDASKEIECKVCGAHFQAEFGICPSCGTDCQAEVRAVEEPAAPQQFIPSYVPQVPVKKKHTVRNVILGIIGGFVAALVLLGIIGAMLENEEAAYYSESDYTYTEEDTAYTKGSFDGTVYTNEWADISFTMPEGFYNADDSMYATMASDTTQCGIYYLSDDTTQLIYIAYEKLPTFPAYDEEGYLDIALDALVQNEELSYETAEEYTTVSVAGRTYLKAQCGFTNEYASFANNFYARKQGDYMIIISTVGIDDATCDALVGKIEKYN